MFLEYSVINRMDKTTFDRAININNQIDYLENQKKNFGWKR